MIPAIGDIVRIRSRQYLVEGVDLPPRAGDSTLVRLSCIEDDAQGEPLEVLWEREIDARLLRETDWVRIASRGFDEPRLFSAYLHSLRWSCVTSTDPKLLQAPYRAGIEVNAYQLKPLQMALGMPRVNLFIVDDVGLGKTIEAGLIVRELLRRQKARRVVVCVPPSVVRQWRDEMEERFGLTFVIYDRDYVARARQERGYAVRDAVMVRRLKSDLRAIGEKFPKCNVIRIEIDRLPEDAPELVLSRLLQQYRRAREARLADATKTQQSSAMIVVLSLQRRLLSSIEASFRTLDVHRASVLAAPTRKAPAAAQCDLDLLLAAPDADDERAELPEDEIEREEDAQMDAATRQSKADPCDLRVELDLLDEMAKVARAGRYNEDPRVTQLLASLESVGAGGLIAESDAEAAADPDRARWLLPHLHERKGADPTWAATLDTLRGPRKKGQSPAEWRRGAPIRPVVFRDPGNLDGEVVHLHLEHRVVQRLLGRFLSQGFRGDDLRRACVLRTVEAQPRAVLLGRLSLFGDGGARLHDEVLAAAAEWLPVEQRRGALRPLGETDKADVLKLVEEGLAQPRLREASDVLRDHLRKHAARDVAELTPHLERRAALLVDRARRDLSKRGEAEARDMAAILENQRERILARQREIDEESRQGHPAFDHDEERQLAADRRYWVERLGAIARELSAEPERIRSSYLVKATRVEAVGIVYLWPLSS